MGERPKRPKRGFERIENLGGLRGLRISREPPPGVSAAFPLAWADGLLKAAYTHLR
jgi:hypothetical protein